MPANLSPEYKKAEYNFRAAHDDRERLECLKDMLRTIPKHKGTEHLQADIKSRIKLLTEELAGPRKGAVRSGPVTTIRPEGAAQLALIGPPNSGKSSLHRALTGSRAAIGPYPHTTQEPMAGMCPCEDIWLQLVDLPPLSPDYVPPWIHSALQPAAGVLLVVDLADPECTDQLLFVLDALRAKNIELHSLWPGRDAVRKNADDGPFLTRLPSLLLANKSDLAAAGDDLAVLLELTGIELPAFAISVQTGSGLQQLAPYLFDRLGIVRVYTKSPGKPADMRKPFTLVSGDTVLDLAALVHKDIAGSLKYARAWGRNVFDGQQVGPEHRVEDGDILELHMH
jgi:ribosome-interacting GTPase 1